MLEKDLGDKLIQYCKTNEIHYVPEFSNWDLVVQHNRILCGIQLKLDLNVKAISQCVTNGGVDFKLVVFNKISRNAVDQLFPILMQCKIIPVIYIAEHKDDNPYKRLSDPEIIPDQFIVHPNFYNNKRYYNKSWLLNFKFHPKKRLDLPDYEFNIPAGSKSPLNISMWKINICKLEILAKQQGGWVTKNQIKDHKINTPREYFQFGAEKKWYLIREPSKDFPYIVDALNKGSNL